MAAYVHEMKKVAQEVFLKPAWRTLEDQTVQPRHQEFFLVDQHPHWSIKLSTHSAGH